MTLQKKIDFAIHLLQMTAEHKQDIELCYSGGKDSDVILEMARMAGIPFTPIYKNTTIDPPGTIRHCQEQGVQIVQPRKSFFQIIEEKGMPSRFARFCCSELKEYKIKDTAILGIRREESHKRAERYKEPTLCRVYSKKEGDRCEQILPILEWTIEDVEEFVQERNIKLHPLYYNEDGSLNCKRRLGCMCCPLKSDKGLADFKAHPKMVRAWIKHAQVWWDKERKKPLKSKELFSDVYELFAFHIMHDNVSDMHLNKESLWQTDYKQVLEDYFKIEL